MLAPQDPDLDAKLQQMSALAGRAIVGILWDRGTPLLVGEDPAAEIGVSA